MPTETPIPGSCPTAGTRQRSIWATATALRSSTRRVARQPAPHSASATRCSPTAGERSVSVDEQIRHRFTVLTWAVGITAALVIAALGNMVTMSYQLGATIGRLDVLISH